MSTGLKGVLMIRVGFLDEYSKEWLGGVNYLANLLFALNEQEKKQIYPIVFLGRKTEKDIVDKLSLHATIVHDSLFDRGSLKWLVEKLITKLFGIPFFTVRLLKHYNIQVVSHSNKLVGYESFARINWIPDFQHLYLPHLFPANEIQRRDQLFTSILEGSERVIVSSHDAYAHAIGFSPQAGEKLRVLHFVAQPYSGVLKLGRNHLTLIEQKYGFSGRFFYLPNQFWQHKNHRVVFDAVYALKKQGFGIQVICSGKQSDFRNQDYPKKLQRFVQENALQDNIRLLGVIDYADVLFLMRYAVAVLNPSLFEGWSSTVEECKSLGKNMILSDIPIHREQNPPQAIFFAPDDVPGLSVILQNIWEEDAPVPNDAMELAAKRMLKKRTTQFAEQYQAIVTDALNISSEDS